MKNVVLRCTKITARLSENNTDKNLSIPIANRGKTKDGVFFTTDFVLSDGSCLLSEAGEISKLKVLDGHAVGFAQVPIGTLAVTRSAVQLDPVFSMVVPTGLYILRSKEMWSELGSYEVELPSGAIRVVRLVSGD